VTAGNPLFALILALFMLGYIVCTTDRPAARVSPRASLAVRFADALAHSVSAGDGGVTLRIGAGRQTAGGRARLTEGRQGVRTTSKG